MTENTLTAAKQSERQSRQKGGYQDRIKQAEQDAAKLGGKARAREAEHEAERTEAIRPESTDRTWKNRHRIATVYGTDPDTGDMTIRNVYGQTYGHENPGTWPGRAFLAACGKAARIATKSRRDDPTTEAVAAEVCLRIMASTHGEPLKVGTLNRDDRTQDGDRRAMAGIARNILRDALSESPDAAGLAAGIAPVADSLDAEHESGTLADTLSAAEVAEQAAADAADLNNIDPAMLAGTNPEADCLPDAAARAAEQVAAETGRGRAAAAVAIRRILRPEQSAAQVAPDLSADAAKKAAQRGRVYLAEAYAAMRVPVARWSDRTWQQAEQLACLAEADTLDREARHLLEIAPVATYRKPKHDWPQSATQEQPVRTRQATAAERATWQTS